MYLRRGETLPPPKSSVWNHTTGPEAGKLGPSGTLPVNFLGVVVGVGTREHDNLGLRSETSKYTNKDGHGIDGPLNHSLQNSKVKETTLCPRQKGSISS